MEGVTTAIVAFIFVCIVYPSIVKTRPQFYAALGAVVLVILFGSLSQIVNSLGFTRFVAALDGLLQVAAILLLIMSCGGLTVRQIASDIGQTIDVVRRGGEKETIIVPLRGEQPASREEREVGSVPPRPSRPRPDDSSLPLE